MLRFNLKLLRSWLVAGIPVWPSPIFIKSDYRLFRLNNLFNRITCILVHSEFKKVCPALSLEVKNLPGTVNVVGSDLARNRLFLNFRPFILEGKDQHTSCTAHHGEPLLCPCLRNTCKICLLVFWAG